MIIRDIAIAFGIEVDNNSMAAAENGIKSLKGMAAKMLGAIGLGFSLVQLNAVAEEFNGINDKIRSATDGLGDQQEIQQKILKAANDTKSSYGDMSSKVSQLIKSDSSLFGSVDEAARFATITTQLFRTANMAEGDIASIQDGLNQSFSKGVVDARLMNNLYRNAPEAINILAKSLGTSKEKLIDMANSGALSTAQLKSAFIASAGTISENYNQLDFSISDAILNIRNQWGLYVDGLNSSVGITQTIARFMVRGFGQVLEVLKKVQNFTERAADKLGGMGNLMKLVAASAGIIYAAMKAAAIKKFLDGAVAALKAIKTSTLTSALAFLGLFLLVEDFIAFLQGKDSIIGKVLESMGIDTDKVRDSFKWLGDMAGDAIQWITGNLDKLVPLLYGLAVVMAVIKAATTAWSIAQAALNLIMSLNPVMLVVLAIMALVAAFVILWNQSEGFRNFWIGLWDGIKAIAAAVADWFSTAWNTAIDAVIGFFRGFYDTVMGILQPIFDFIDKVKNGVASAVDKVKGWFGIKGSNDVSNAAGQLAQGATANTTSYAAGGISNRNVTQNVSIANTFNGGTANAQKQGATAMGKSANDATGYMARGLAYAR